MPHVVLGTHCVGAGADEQIAGKEPAVFSFKKADVVAFVARGMDYLEMEMLGNDFIADFLDLAGDGIAPDLFLKGIELGWLVGFVYC